MTQETKHTPSPWVYKNGPSFYGLFGPQGEMLLTYTTDDDGVHCTNQTDAQLITAAPDLLESLEMALDDVEGSYDGGDLSFGWVTKARAAIAKSRGK